MLIEAGVGKKENLLLSNGTSVDCIEEFCYLGDMPSSGGGAGKASRVRVRCAWKKFRELSPILTSCHTITYFSLSSHFVYGTEL